MNRCKTAAILDFSGAGKSRFQWSDLGAVLYMYYYPQINNLKLKQFCYTFCPTSTIKVRSFTGLVTKLKL